MDDPHKNAGGGSFLKRAAHRSLFARLPWSKVLTSKVLFFILAPVVIMALLTVPQMALDVYHKSPPATAAIRGLEAFGLGVLMWSLMGLVFVLCTAMTWQMVLDLIQLFREIGKGIKAIPAAWRKFLAACSRGYQRIKAVPSAIRSMDREQWALVVFMTFGFGLLGAIAYLGWPLASHVAARLPHWLAPQDKFGVIMLDLFASVMVWAFAFPVLTSVIFSLFPFLRPRRSNKNVR